MKYKLATVLGACLAVGACDGGLQLTGPKFLGTHETQVSAFACNQALGVGGRFGRGLVQEEATAKAIAVAIIRELYGKKSKSSSFSLENNRECWKVRAHPRVGVYGGGIVFDIDKCTGGVKNVEFPQ